MYNWLMPTQNVNLSTKQAEFIRERIGDGGYRNASEVVRAGLRMLEQREKEDKLKLRALRRIANEAFEQIDRGEFVPVDPTGLDQFLTKLDAKTRPRKS
jgi:antitoxin ParD1/3/4